MSRSVLVLPILLTGLLRVPHESAAELIPLRLGGEEGMEWSDRVALNVMVDHATVPGAIQPLVLDPLVNVATQIGPWYRFREPVELDSRPGMPHIWRAIGDIRDVGPLDPLDLVDGDLNTFKADKDYTAQGTVGLVNGEFYTLDLGTQIPAERFVLRPPAGKDLTGEPYDNYAFPAYELTAGNDEVAIKLQDETWCQNKAPVYGAWAFWCSGLHIPLEFPLAAVEENIKATIEVTFARQYLRFFRMRLIPDAGCCIRGDNTEFRRYAIAELEVYGRGAVRKATWESRPIPATPANEEVNIGQVRFGVSTWRQEGDQLQPDPEAPTAVTVLVRTGLDETPMVYHTYDDLGRPTEVSAADYARLKPRRFPFDPPALGWAGPITEDRESWSFWSAPLQVSGEQPRLPRGRFVMVRVEMETESPETFARVESLVVETSPLLARRVLGEVAVVEDLQPEAKVALLRAGEPTELVCEMKAEFAAGQTGFDAVRVRAPSAVDLIGLELGDPPEPVPEADYTVIRTGGAGSFTLHLPPPGINPEGHQRLRMRLETAVYGVSDGIRVEVFRRDEAGLPQQVEAGDVSAEVGTDQLRLAVRESSLGSVLSAVSVRPAVCTPQGDGINDVVSIDYTLFRVLAAPAVEVGVYTLGGQRVWQRVKEFQAAGPGGVEWDGRAEHGGLVPPGVYVARVRVETDQGDFERTRAVAVAY